MYCTIIRQNLKYQYLCWKQGIKKTEKALKNRRDKSYREMSKKVPEVVKKQSLRHF